jgi:hypothetical protein
VLFVADQSIRERVDSRASRFTSESIHERVDSRASRGITGLGAPFANLVDYDRSARYMMEVHDGFSVVWLREDLLFSVLYSPKLVVIRYSFAMPSSCI